MTENEALDPYNNDPRKWEVLHERNRQHQGNIDGEAKAEADRRAASSEAVGKIPLPTGCAVILGIAVLVGVVAAVVSLLNKSPTKPVVAQQIPAKGHHAEKLKLRPPMATRLELKSDQPVDVLVLTESGYQAFNSGGLAGVNPKDVHFRTQQSQTKLKQMIVTNEKQGLHGWVVVINPGTKVASIQIAAQAVWND